GTRPRRGRPVRGAGRRLARAPAGGARVSGAEVVFVLHAMQPLTADPVAALGAGGAEGGLVSSAPGAPRGRGGVATDAAAHRVPAADWAAHIARHAAGRPYDVVTNDEYCLVTCARLRAAAGLPARHPADLAPYLDKVIMKRALNAAGIGTARYRV